MAPTPQWVRDLKPAPPQGVDLIKAEREKSKISVEKLEEVKAADPDQFAPTDEMRAKGRTVEMAAATKISRFHGQAPLISGMTIRPVCVFGMVTPTGHLVEAHSLQPSDPNSQAALEDAKQIDFSPTIRVGGPPRQHFVFVIEKFASR